MKHDTLHYSNHHNMLLGNHTQINKHQLPVVLFIAWCVEVTLYRFSREGWKLVANYVMMFSHCIVQFGGFGISFRSNLSCLMMKLIHT